jgi:uncharacterized cupredoxin-like copper-binding protein
VIGASRGGVHDRRTILVFPNLISNTEMPMNRAAAFSALFAASLALAACSAAKSGDETAPVPVADSASIVSAADWSKSQAIGVTLSSFDFAPADFTFQHGQPYKLHLVNNADDTHTFSSDTFFQAIAVRKVVRNGVSAPGVTGKGIPLGPHEQADLFFVPVAAGTYRIYCDQFMHDTMGMHGSITIQ